MVIELVTGKKGTVHVDSADDGALYAAIAGKGEYVLDLDDQLACTMTTANKAHVASGHGLMQGRHWLIDAEGVDLTIQNGTQGQKRNDLIVARYECDAKNGNIESVALKVIKGTPTTGTPADPACTRGDILEGAALVNEQPLWRIPLNGITVGTPIQMFDVLTPAKEAWDSVAPTADGWRAVRLPGGVFEADKQVRVTTGSSKAEIASLTVQLPFAAADTGYRVLPALCIGKTMSEFMPEYDVELMIGNKTTSSFNVVIHRGSFALLGANSAWDVDLFIRGSLP